MSKFDPRNFLLNTDYEMDKIIYFKEGSLNANDYDIPISHKLGFAPLIFGVCAFNEDFSDPRTIPFEQITQSNTIQFTAQANSNELRLSYLNYSGSPAKIYYRIYAFEPTDVYAKVGQTSNHASKLILNTDYNYCKLFKKGIVVSDTVIKHDFGYVPQVLAWKEVNDYSHGLMIEPSEESLKYNEPGGGNFGITVNSSNVTIHDLASMQGFIQKVHYRIYYDEA